MSNTIHYEAKNHIATITLNKPEVCNAFDDAFIEELTSLVDTAGRDNSVRIVVIKANGKHFSAGADINWMKRMGTFSEAENKKDALALVHLLKTLNGVSKPTVALAQGKTFGGGLGLLACCDIVIACDDAQFCFSEVRLGLVAATIAPYVLRKMGYSQTLRYFLTAEVMSAQTAKATDLIHVVTDESLDTAAHALIETLSKNGPNALATVKQLLNTLSPIDESTTEYTANLLANVRCSDEAQKGLQAFLTKGKPKWQ